MAFRVLRVGALIEKLKVDCSYRCRDGRYTIEASVVTELPKGARLKVTLDGGA